MLLCSIGQSILLMHLYFVKVVLFQLLISNKFSCVIVFGIPCFLSGLLSPLCFPPVIVCLALISLTLCLLTCPLYVSLCLPICQFVVCMFYELLYLFFFSVVVQFLPLVCFFFLFCPYILICHYMETVYLETFEGGLSSELYTKRSTNNK